VDGLSTSATSRSVRISLQGPGFVQVRHEHVRLDQHVGAPRDVGRGSEQHSRALTLEIVSEPQTQALNQDLMPQPRRRGDQQVAVHDLVAVAVVRQRADRVSGVIAGCGHAHTFVSAAGE